MEEEEGEEDLREQIFDRASKPGQRTKQASKPFHEIGTVSECGW